MGRSSHLFALEVCVLYLNRNWPAAILIVSRRLQRVTPFQVCKALEDRGQALSGSVPRGHVVALNKARYALDPCEHAAFVRVQALLLATLQDLLTKPVVCFTLLPFRF